MRTIVKRRGWTATYGLDVRGRFFAVSLWRRRRTGNLGAVSFMAPIGHDGVPVQVVFGDWWRVERSA